MGVSLRQSLVVAFILCGTTVILVTQTEQGLQLPRYVDEALLSPRAKYQPSDSLRTNPDAPMTTTVEIEQDASFSLLKPKDRVQAMTTATKKGKSGKPRQRETTSASTATKPLNILIMYPDDMRHDSLGSAGTQPVFTPFLDSLARKGMRFTHNCVTTSICWVSRATLFTGQYLSRHKSELLEDPIFYHYWNQTWPYLLQQAGYFTGHIGKWQYINYTWVEQHYNWTRLHEGYHWFEGWGPDGGNIHAADLAMNQAIEFLTKERPRDRPFALTVAFYPPKAIGEGPEQYFPKNTTKKLYENITIPEPYNWNASYYRLPFFLRDNNEARVRWRQRFSTAEAYQTSMRNYFALITEVDAACKRIVDVLKQQGILNETLIIFSTDNGYFHGEHGLAGKWYPYQESIRVPLIIRDPRMPESKRGQVDDSFTLNIDLASTILGAAQLEQPSVMQGRDIADLYLSPTGKATWRKEFYYEHMSMGADYIPRSSAVVRKDFKYFFYEEWNTEQLYDLKNDPHENHDLSNRSEYASLMEAMRKRHDELKQQVV